MCWDVPTIPTGPYSNILGVLSHSGGVIPGHTEWATDHVLALFPVGVAVWITWYYGLRAVGAVDRRRPLALAVLKHLYGKSYWLTADEVWKCPPASRHCRSWHHVQTAAKWLGGEPLRSTLPSTAGGCICVSGVSESDPAPCTSSWHTRCGEDIECLFGDKYCSDVAGWGTLSPSLFELGAARTWCRATVSDFGSRIRLWYQACICSGRRG